MIDERVPVVLERAAVLIERRGWRTGGYARPAPDKRDTAPLDVTNAVRVAVDEIEPPPAGGRLILAACDAFLAHVAPELAAQGRGVSRWNDRAGLTAQDVTRALREAASALREPGARLRRSLYDVEPDPDIL